MDTTHVTVLYSFLPDASVFGIEPENVGGGLVFEVNFGGILIVQENTCCTSFTLKALKI